MRDVVVLSVCCGVAAGLLVAEITALSACAARWIVRRAAHAMYGRDTDLALERAEEWQAMINARPGNLFKFGTALWYAGAILSRLLQRAGRRVRRARRPLAAVPAHCFSRAARSLPIGTWVYRCVILAMLINMVIGALARRVQDVTSLGLGILLGPVTLWLLSSSAPQLSTSAARHREQRR
ncbi:hypothetical protein [Actinomadura sp. BRA 177]|uniref:hypothetical protein n=1 Tax=Actinomadura sp. BRA 177 TaxID=2745202 RepID=UPI0015963633|nr:hypothetical protein [Actinomadura sp. BRA 177]NVI86422.1 hypothetical protein [Actinomadura sp. BRA 177]